MKALLNYKTSDLLFFDVETARTVDKLVPGTPLYDAFQYKARYQNEMKEKLSRNGSDPEVSLEEFFKEKAALYATFGRIVAIVVGRIDGEQLKTKKYVGEEKKLLESFNNDLSQFTVARPAAALAGYNSIGFDLPFINKRMIVQDIQPPDLLDNGDKKPWEIRTLDLAKLWQGTSFYPDSLMAVCAALGIPSSKGNMNGSEVSDAFYAGRITEIADYCEQDVLATANLFQRFSRKKLLTLAT